MDAARLRANGEMLRNRIERACRAAGRDPAAITLVAVTKSVDTETTRALYDLGFHDLGENRPVEGAAKTAAVARPARWHFIGHLQTNKVNRVLAAFQVIHSVDRPDLAAALDRKAASSGQRIPCFIQVNASGEASKGGIAAAGVGTFLERAVREWPRLVVMGLMTMAPDTTDPEAARPWFRKLRELAERHSLRDLSMGMTNDFEVAIAEGATHLRIGSAFFEGLG